MSPSTLATTEKASGATESDAVVGNLNVATDMHRTAAAAPVFRMPPPALPRPRPPTYIYMPGYAVPGYAGPVPQDRTILVEMRPDLDDTDIKVFETEQVLKKLGPRIKRAATGVPALKPRTPAL